MKSRASRLLALSAVLLMGILPGCSSKPSEPTETDTRFDANKSVFAGVRDGKSLTLFEGLPNDFLEGRELEHEKKTKETVTIHDFLFYRETLDLSDADANAIKLLLGDERSFKPFSGYKKCGGFHPDYCVETGIDGTKCQFLLCFGCGEAKIYGPRGELYCDLERNAYEQLKQLLKKYRKNRPYTD